MRLVCLFSLNNLITTKEESILKSRMFPNPRSKPYSSGKRSLSLLIDTVAIAPDNSSFSCNFNTYALSRLCSLLDKFTSRMIPQWGSLRNTVSSPKSLSKVINILFSLYAIFKISSSPGSLVKSPDQIVSIPNDLSSFATPPHTQVSKNTFTRPGLFLAVYSLFSHARSFDTHIQDKL